jgi:hypothetical protein
VIVEMDVVSTPPAMAKPAAEVVAKVPPTPPGDGLLDAYLAIQQRQVPLHRWTFTGLKAGKHADVPIILLNAIYESELASATRTLFLTASVPNTQL